MQDANLHCTPRYQLITKSAIGVSYLHAEKLDSENIYDRDLDYDYVGFKTLEKYYLLKIEGKVVERPQHMLMRVAVGIHKDDIDSVIKTYELTSQSWFTQCWDTQAPRKAKKVVKAQKLWYEVFKSQIETGTPYMLFKDSCNRKSNQKNLGTINSSTLCAEIIEYTSPTETAVCNLASIALPQFVRVKGVSAESQPSKLVGSIGSGNRYFDFDKLAEITLVVTTNLNKTIDVNYYPVETAKMSNRRHRPIGIGVQGLADTFILLGMPYDSPEAQQLNKDIFETIYYHALKASSGLAKEEGVYETYNGSPVSKGILQPDMWDVTPSEKWDWKNLRSMIAKNGVRNSLLVALMPTALTSQILGNNECFAPYNSNISSHKVSHATCFVVNKHLLHDITQMGLWSPDLMNHMIPDGSVQKISVIPEDLKAIYKTVWEIEQRTLVDMGVDRGCYIDQSQSLNIHVDRPNFDKLTALHFHAWSKVYQLF
ncbi:hypothetical protein Lser_V15G12601 [Lactuca serriola]